MKELTSKLFICVILFAPLALRSVEINDDELKAITNLIETTEKRLENQKKIRELMVVFREENKAFEKGKEEKRIGYQMAKTADKIILLIEAEHLQTLFSSSYMEELIFYRNLLKMSPHGQNSPHQ